MPLEPRAYGCDAPETRIKIPATSLWLGPSDWEAEGRVPPRRIETRAFSLDAFEATVGHFACDACPFPDAARMSRGDTAQAMASVTSEQARVYCARRGGRLPTEDEWIAAASGPTSRRYPWGDTGAVCRRAAWGLLTGPCAVGADGPDTVGAHPDGCTALGLFDMAGNAAEWTTRADGTYTLHGGSWRSALATELRNWHTSAFEPASAGVRCAYDD